MFNVIIIGGENTNDYPFFSNKCVSFLKDKAESGNGITILTIGDEYVENFAKKCHIDIQTFYCDWTKYGKDAIKIRNKELIEKADAIIYFDDAKRDHNILYEYAKNSNIKCRKVKNKDTD